MKWWSAMNLESMDPLHLSKSCGPAHKRSVNAIATVDLSVSWNDPMLNRRWRTWMAKLFMTLWWKWVGVKPCHYQLHLCLVRSRINMCGIEINHIHFDSIGQVIKKRTDWSPFQCSSCRYPNWHGECYNEWQRLWNIWDWCMITIQTSKPRAQITVVKPSNMQQVKIIHRMVERVIKNGSAFEVLLQYHTCIVQGLYYWLDLVLGYHHGTWKGQSKVQVLVWQSSMWCNAWKESQ